MNPILLCDFYKTEHYKQYPEGTTMIYSNFTPRKSRIDGVDKVVFFGLQHFIKKYLLGKFEEEFFQRPLDFVLEEYKFAISTDTKHIEALHKLGYLPIEIKALEEGTQCPIGVPCFTIKNTHPDFYWLTNYLETLISTQMWQPITSATIAYEYKKLLSKYAKETTGSADFVQWQGHDFSMRGMSSVESAILSGMGHLTSFTGTDTIPAIYALKSSYNAKGLIGASVPATEHSVMCMGNKESEIDTFSRLLKLYPTGILSVVSDTWNLWKVCTEFLPALKDQILARDGKLVIRPDSGDPVDIICGTAKIDVTELCHKFVKDADTSRFPRELELELNKLNDRHFIYKGKLVGYSFDEKSVYFTKIKPNQSEECGVIELLWDIFGGTIVKGNDGNEYKVLDSHIGAIYGDAITLGRAEEICERLKSKGFASINIVLGIGSFTYQYNTRDTLGMAIKATYGEVKPKCSCSETEAIECAKDYEDGTGKCNHIESREIFKDPVTDDGTKKSKKGLLQVLELVGNDKSSALVCLDQVSWKEEQNSLLETVFKDGKLVKETTLEKIRSKLNV